MASVRYSRLSLTVAHHMKNASRGPSEIGFAKSNWLLKRSLAANSLLAITGSIHALPMHVPMLACLSLSLCVSLKSVSVCVCVRLYAGWQSFPVWSACSGFAMIPGLRRRALQRDKKKKKKKKQPLKSVKASRWIIFRSEVVFQR
jgi:hypothetical protein